MKYKLLLTIFALCLISSILLAFIPVEQICGPIESSCSIVQNSNYEEFMGINNSYFGIIGFLVLIILTIKQIKKPEKYIDTILKTGIILASIVAIYFLYLQFFVIKAICQYCMIVDIGSIFALIAIYAMKNK